MHGIVTQTTPAIMTVRDAIARGAEYLKRHGVDTSRLDAELLVGHVLGKSRLQLFMNLDQPMTAPERDASRDLLVRRGNREPVAYILGRREFRSLDFEVNPNVLIPRPETELLVEHAIEELNARFPSADPLHVFEFGIGSGAVGVSLAKELPKAHIIATDISAGAVDVARRNAARHAVADRIDIRVQADLAGIGTGFHAVLGNPPYVPDRTKQFLPPEIVRYEPEVALYGGEDGLDVYRMLLAALPSLLAPGGFMLSEMGFGQSLEMEELAPQFNLRLERVFDDYAHIPRFALLTPAQ